MKKSTREGGHKEVNVMPRKVLNYKPNVAPKRAYRHSNILFRQLASLQKVIVYTVKTAKLVKCP